MKQLSQSIKLEIVDQIALIISDNPPVNALSSHVRDGIMKGLSEAEANDDIKAIMLYCEGRTFFAGADIREFGKPLDPKVPTVRELISALEFSSKPVFAAIHGTALGGGLETALGCHFRVATGEARFGLPEVNLGIIPGAGGTLRLPRLTGVETGLKMMTTGVPIGAQEALQHGLLDEIMEGDLREQALDFARQITAKNAPLISIRDRDEKIEEARKKPDLFNEFRKSIARKARGFKAPEAIIKSVEASLNMDFEDALVYERELFVACQNSPQARAQQYFFFAERQAGKVSDIPRETTVRTINSVAIIGSGTMGSGIAINFVNAEIPVILLDMSAKALERGLEVIRQGVTKMARRSGLDEPAVQARLSLITGSQQIKELNEVDLVIEAVFEDMKIKKSIFQDLDRICKPGAILATNTSYLDVNKIAAVTSRPQDVVGTHFFSPANIMKLLEIVRAEKTADDVIATCLALGKRINKVSVVVGVCYGFVGNRLLAARRDQSNDMMLKNLMPREIDQVIYDFGFPMGPFAISDLAGLDIGWLGDQTPDKEVNIRHQLCELGRKGQKTGAGFYDYNGGRTPLPSEMVEGMIKKISDNMDILRKPISKGDCLKRMLYSMINEAAKILEEGVVQRASDIDVVWVYGYGWPIHKGGLTFYADQVGLKNIVGDLERFALEYDPELQPAPLLRQLAAEGKGFADY